MSDNDVTVDYEKQMQEGKKCFFCQEFEEAADWFSQACETIATSEDQQPLLYANALYYYGCSMFEISRKESSVFGGKMLNDKDEEENCSSDEEVSDEEVKDDEKNEDEVDDDNVTNFQVTWETLELAKVNYKKCEENDYIRLMVGKCCQKLGDFGLECETYEQAIADYTESLEMYKNMKSTSQRNIASLHYCLALVYCEVHNFQEAKKHCDLSIEILEGIKSSLLKELNEASEEGRKIEIETELKEVVKMVEDIKSKVRDVGARKKLLQMNLLNAATSKVGQTSSVFQCEEIASSSSKPGSSSSTSSTSFNTAVDVNHLVRRRRSDETKNQSPDAPKKKRIHL